MKGLVSDSEWLEVEANFQSLPDDYKRILSAFGFGGFGDFVLFHPSSKHPMFGLPEGSQSAADFLSSQGSDVVDDALREFPLVLGCPAERRYLVHGEKGWAILDFEMESVDFIGSDLISFLGEAYESLSEPGRFTSIARTIWKSSCDGSQDKFFTPSEE